MDRNVQKDILEWWSSEGSADCVLVGTTSLGLGCDLGPLDLVMVTFAPRSVEDLVQMMGRGVTGSEG